MSTQNKIDVRKQNDKVLLTNVNWIDEFRIKYIELDTWDEFFPYIDNAYIYTTKQLEYIKNDFNSRR